MQFAEIDEVQTAIERLDLTSYQAGMYMLKVKAVGLPDAVKKFIAR